MRQWLIVAVAVTLGCLGVYAVYQHGYAVGQERAAAQHSAQTAKAERAARTREQELIAEKQKLEERHAENQRVSAAAAAAARSELDRLRHALASRRPAPSNPPAQPLPVGPGDTEREILAECAAEVQGLAAEADRLADKVTGLQDYVKNLCMGTHTPTIGPLPNNLE